MNKKWFLNMSSILPLALWGFALNSLNFRTLKTLVPSEIQTGIIIACGLIGTIFTIISFL